jgi:hypothetical protein
LMDAHTLLSDLRRRGFSLGVRDGEQIVLRPVSRLTEGDCTAIRQCKAELLRLLTEPTDDSLVLTPSLATVADAIASAPRSSFLDDLAIARAARVYIETIRIIRSKPHAFGREATPLVDEMMTRAADAIRRNDYAHAFDLFDLLVEKARNLRAH